MPRAKWLFSLFGYSLNDKNGEMTLENNEDDRGVVYSRWDGGGGIEVRMSDFITALGMIRDTKRRVSLHKACCELSKALQADQKTIDKKCGLIQIHNRTFEIKHGRVHIRKRCCDFPLELMVLNKSDEDSFAGLRHGISHRFAAAPRRPRGTVQRIFFVDGSENAPRVTLPNGKVLMLDSIKRGQIRPMIDALPNYKRQRFSPGEFADSGLYVVCDSADANQRSADLKFLNHRSIRRAEARQSIIIYAGHVVYGQHGQPMIVVGDRTLPVERLLALDSRPELIILAGCGPEKDEHMLSAPKRLMGRHRSGARAYGVISGAYPVRFDAAVALFERLLDKMAHANGRETLDELLRRACEEAYYSTPDASLGILGFRYFGHGNYRPQLPWLHQKCWERWKRFLRALLSRMKKRWVRLKRTLRVLRNWRKLWWAWLAAALLLAVVLLAGRSKLRTQSVTIGLETSPPAATDAVLETATAAVGTGLPPVSASPAITLEPASAGTPSFGGIAFHSGGTLTVTVLGWTDDYALGAFLHVRGTDNNQWYCKDTGMTREGNCFTVHWRAEGTDDDRADKISLFLYKKTEVSTTTSYSTVKGASAKELEVPMQ
jgi:hypothetical protein